MGQPVWNRQISLWAGRYGTDRYCWPKPWAGRCDMDILVDCPFIILVFSAIRPACINWVQSLYRPTRFNGLQYHSGRGPLARMVRQIVKPGIRYGTGNSTEWSASETLDGHISQT